MRPHDIPLSGVRKSCRRWFLRVFSLSRSIGTPEPVSKGLSGRRYEMGVGRWNGCEWVEKWWTPLCAASTWICIPPELPATILTSLSLTAVFSSTQLGLFFSLSRSLCARPALSRPEKLQQPAEPSHQVKIHHVRPIPRASRHPEYQERSFQINVPSV